MDYCWAWVYCYEGFQNVGGLTRDNSTHSYGLGWGISQKDVFRIEPSIRDKVTWELEGRGRPIWNSLGSGLMGPSQLSLWLQYGTGLGDTEAPKSSLTNAEK